MHNLRLQVYLSRNGVCSRRQAMTLIQDGCVKINGRIINEPSYPVYEGDVISVHDRDIKEKSYTYIMLNKPKGYVTTKADRFAEKTVMDLLPKHFRHLVPVGRLDKDTEGLLLLTNDGDLTYRLTHPKFDVDKIYSVRIIGQLERRSQKIMESGMFIDHEKTSNAKVEHVKFFKNHTEFQMTIHEGKKRQIRRMLAALGYRVVHLERLSQGPLNLGHLKIGHWRELSSDEVERLRGSKK